MVNNYPLLFRKKVVEYYLYQNKTIKSTLKIFGISKSSLFNWKNKYESNMLNEKEKYYKVNLKIDSSIKTFIYDIINKNTNFNYLIILSKIKAKFNLQISKSSLYNIINELNFSKKRIRKKPIYGDLNKLKIRKKNFKKQIKKIRIDKIISIDETSVDSSVIDNYGWSSKGTRIYKRINAVRNKYTIICAISNKKIVSYKILKGSANRETFKEFISENKTKFANYNLLLDNARIHHAKIVKETMKKVSNNIIYNVPYSPELNPIEMLFSIFKNKMKNKSIKNMQSIKEELDKLSEKLEKSYFRKIFRRSLR